MASAGRFLPGAIGKALRLWNQADYREFFFSARCFSQLPQDASNPQREKIHRLFKPLMHLTKTDRLIHS